MNKPFTIYGAKGSGSIPVEAAMTLLLAMLEGRELERREVLLRSELILRNSVARLGPGEPDLRISRTRRS